MYSITLKSGTVIEGLEKNEDMFISNTAIDAEALSAAELKKVTITDGTGTTETIVNATTDGIRAWTGGKWAFNVREMTKTEEIMECLMELSEAVYA